MATLKDIQLRLKSVKNIEKITKSMKMISSTKLNRAQKAMEVGRVYGKSCNEFSRFTEVKSSEAPQQQQQQPQQQRLVLACSSDRGLCGGIHSSVSKVVRKMAAEHRDSTSVVVLGDKAKPQICRDARRNIKMHFAQVGKNIPTFVDASVIASEVLQLEKAADNVKLVYNEFRSAIAFETKPVQIYTLQDYKNADKMAVYEYEDEQLENFVEFAFASQLFHALVEGHASEMAARRTAMDNASKNAGEIIHGLTLKYNRTRQAVITNELVDIITGASAL